MTRNENVKHLFTHSLINLFTSKKLVAFTLAEVLITLGIIGVVAAMTIPVLISKYNKTMTEVRLKETYSKLMNMAKLSVAEFGEFDPSGDVATTDFSPENGKIIFEKYFMPFIKVNYKYSDSECVNLSKSYGASQNSQQFIDMNGACYNLVNGTSIIFWTGKQTTDFFLYPVRINLYPNKQRKVEGKDVFAFYIDFNEKGVQLSSFVRVMGLNPTDEQLKQFCIADSGRITYGGYYIDRSNFCTELILRNGLKIPADYPIKF